MKKFVLIVFTILYGNLYAQDTLNLQYCRQRTIATYPLNKDFENNLKANRLKIKNIKTIYYPVLNLTGQYIHVSDVPHYVSDNPMLQIPVIGNDQYKIMLEAKQVLFDGGLTKKQKTLEESTLAVQNKNTKVKLYTLNEQINDVYFLILLFQEQKRLLELTRKTLNEQLKIVQSGVKNGVLLPGDADVLTAEILKTEQNISELDAGKNSGLEILANLMDTTISPETYLKLPQITAVPENPVIKRPEYDLFSAQQKQLQNSAELNQVKRFPYIAAFGTFGYGYPGLNMLQDQADIIYTFGLNLSWTIWDWNKTKREKQIFAIQQDMVNTQKEVFNKNLQTAISKEKSEIKKMNDLLTKDEKIIEIRQRISKTKASQLRNGVITSSEYIRELNNETMAKVNRSLHKIQRLQAIVKYNTLIGR
ncbi:MAG: TolC family protein [Bacteroidales bacterium]|nr:TolC family protein [Bacteroidales bacterium]